MSNCIFCKIIEREIPATIAYEDKRIIAFEDVNPQAPVHILLIPKEHFTSLNDMPESKKDIVSHIFIKAKEIAKQKNINDSGFRIVLNTGKNSGQAVFHIHFHLLGGRRMTWPPG